jgi:hypothetical protein
MVMCGPHRDEDLDGCSKPVRGTTPCKFAAKRLSLEIAPSKRILYRKVRNSRPRIARLYSVPFRSAAITFLTFSEGTEMPLQVEEEWTFFQDPSIPAQDFGNYWLIGSLSATAPR